MQPTEIVADRTDGTLTVTWDDGTQSVYGVTLLRWRCPCAVCSGEWGRPGRLNGLSTLPDEELTLADIRMVGAYGISPVWASGHDTGIYTWEYLRTLG